MRRHHFSRFRNGDGATFGNAVQSRGRGWVEQIEFVDQEPAPFFHGNGERPIHKIHSAAGIEPIAADQFRCFQPGVGDDVPEGDVEPGRDLDDDRGFAAAGGAGEVERAFPQQIPGEQVGQGCLPENVLLIRRWDRGVSGRPSGDGDGLGRVDVERAPDQQPT